ncbi:hypothetical protein HYC85_030076 [Camellia sinensis]|uniref:Uncharacterized protein n=1 Tax=Camellia sinensis TaxID=4442 RepID=A0A7J7G0H6_CAMSI|nr:hypothetical protein HYC85_030076 [Camellia sinensis]
MHLWGSAFQPVNQLPRLPAPSRASVTRPLDSAILGPCILVRPSTSLPSSLCPVRNGAQPKLCPAQVLAAHLWANGRSSRSTVLLGSQPARRRTSTGQVNIINHDLDRLYSSADSLYIKGSSVDTSYLQPVASVLSAINGDTWRAPIGHREANTPFLSDFEFGRVQGDHCHSWTSQDRAAANYHRAQPINQAIVSRPQMGKFRYLVETPAALAAFREEYGVPADVHLELAEEETTPWGREECPFTVLSIVEGGLRFPLNPLITEFLRRTGLAPTQVSTNTYRIINGVHELNNRLGIRLGLAEVLRQYTLGHTGDGLAYYLKIRPGREKIVTGTPDKDLHDDDFFWVSGNYETAEVPGWMISKNFGSTSIQALQANYNFPNVEAIRTALRYRD